VVDAGDENTGVGRRNVDMEGYDVARRIACPIGDRRARTASLTGAAVRARPPPGA
jgi:hypothetical protein